MINIPTLSTHAERLERWLGKDACERLSENFKHWHGPPVAVANVPGRVFVRGGGDFVGPIRGGYYSHLWDYAETRLKKLKRDILRNERRRMNTGLASLDEIISAATTAGRRRNFPFIKTATIGTANRAGTLFYVTGVASPASGALAAGAPGGRVCDSSIAGAFPFVDPAGGLTQHLINAFIGTSVDGQTLMLYDRLFDVAKTMASSAGEAVTTGQLTRYQSLTSTDLDYAGGNFAFPEAQATLPATAHNHNAWQYTDQAGNTAQAIPSIAGNANCQVNNLDLPVGAWFMPLAAGDTGVVELSQIGHSASIASGAIAAAVGHPIAVFPSGQSGALVPFDGINSAMNLVRIFDDACLALLVMPTASTSATTFWGEFNTLAN